MLNFRDRVLVSTSEGQIEGYVFSILPGGKELYVILTGFNTKPILVESRMVELISDIPVKRKRGRPRKNKK